MKNTTSIAMFTLFAFTACDLPDVDVDTNDVFVNFTKPTATWKLELDGKELSLNSSKVQYLAYKDGILLLGRGISEDQSAGNRVELVVEMNQAQQWPPPAQQPVSKDAAEAGVALIRADGRWGSTEGKVTTTWGDGDDHRMTVKFDVTLTHEDRDETLHLTGEIRDGLNINCLPKVARPANEKEATKLLNDFNSFKDSLDTDYADSVCAPLKPCKEWFSSAESDAVCSH